MGATEGFMKAQIEHLEEENRKLRLGKERLEELEKIKDEIKDLRQENNYLKLIQKDNESQISCYFKERDELREKIRKLKEDNRFLTKISKEYMKKENIVEVAEFTELYKDDLEKENKNLKKENKRLMSDLITTIEERDNAFKKIEQLKEELGKLVMSKSKD